MAETPVVHGATSAGIFSVSFRDSLHGMVVGGDNGNADGYTDNVAVTVDGGASWTLAGRPTLAGAVYGAAYVPGVSAPTVVAVGPKGADYSSDDGTTWISLDTRKYWSVGFGPSGTGWMVGPEGRITKVRFGP